MKDNVRLMALKLAALSAMFLLVYPGILIFRTLLFKSSGLPAEHAFAAIITGAAFGIGNILLRGDSRMARWLATRGIVEILLEERATAAVLSRALSYITLIFPVLFAALVYLSSGIIRFLFEGLTLLIFYTIGIRGNLGGFGSVLSNVKANAGIFAYGAYIFVSSSFAGYHHLKVPFLFFACIFILVALLIQNQSNLDAAFLKKSLGLQSVPRNIRKYNFLVILVLFLVIFLMFNLKSIVLFLFDTAGWMLQMLIWMYMKLVSIFMPGEVNMRQQPGATFPFYGAGENPENPWWNLVYNTIGWFILLYTIYKLTPAVVRKIIQGLGWAAAFLKRLFIRRENDRNPAEGDYDDEVETLASEEEKRPVKRRGIFRKSLHRITDPVERVRMMYRLAVTLLMERVEIGDSDTTGEICQKAQKVSGAREYFAHLTSLYNRVRYGSHVPEKAEVGEVSDSYNKVTQLLKSRG